MTAYEMRISDWSSDVCSSDLRRLFEAFAPCRVMAIAAHRNQRLDLCAMADVDIVRAKVAGIGQQLLRLIQTFGQRLHCVQHRRDLLFVVAGLGEVWRWEERRVGEECCRPCRSGRSSSH